MKLIDDIVPEPLGGAHKDLQAITESTRQALHKHLKELEGLCRGDRVEARYEKFRKIGMYQEMQAEAVEKVYVKSEKKRSRKKMASAK